MNVRRRGLILDRDGVVNHDIGFLHRPEDCRFVDGIFDMTRSFSAAHFAIVIATNQSGIARGLFSEAEYRRLMDWMRGEFACRGVTLDGIYHCPYHPTEGLGAYRRDSEWRKPRPGMLIQAAADLGLDLGRSWCVGDSMRDIDAGRAAGVGTLVRLDPTRNSTSRADHYWVAPSLAAVTALFLRADTATRAATSDFD
jgi:D-glycero-D-manno-heptose 1,7-bisphosphate phosphatase